MHSADHREDEKYSSRLKIFFSIGPKYFGYECSRFLFRIELALKRNDAFLEAMKRNRARESCSDANCAKSIGLDPREFNIEYLWPHCRIQNRNEDTWNLYSKDLHLVESGKRKKRKYNQTALPFQIMFIRDSLLHNLIE